MTALAMDVRELSLDEIDFVGGADIRDAALVGAGVGALLGAVGGPVTAAAGAGVGAVIGALIYSMP